MRRYLRDNESIPIPANWNIMRFIDTIEKRRRKQFGFEAPLYKSKSPVKKSPAKKQQIEVAKSRTVDGGKIQKYSYFN